MTAREDGQTRILLYFLLGIAVPSGLLGYLAFRGIQNDRALIERERRVALEEAAARIDSTAQSLLEAAGRAVAASSPEALERVLREHPLVEAVFALQPDGAVRVVAAGGLLFERDAAPLEPVGDRPIHALLDSAAALELRAGDLESALDTYERALRRAPDPAAAARALGGVARVQRKLGRWSAAVESYERLQAEFADLPSAGGIPPGPAARLELARVLLQVGDTARARTVLLELHDDLVAGRWSLTPARFDLIARTGAAILDSLERAGARGSEASQLRALVAREVEQRERALTLLSFEERARGLLSDHGPGARRVTVDARGRRLPAVLLEAPSDSGGAGRRGFVVDPAALARGAMAGLPEAAAGALAWKLRTVGGGVSDSSPAAAAPGSPSASLALADFVPWILELAPSASGSDGNFLTSRRAIYLYAFVLLAGILLFGLILSIRTVGRELELARMKSDFVSTVSHEFKSPLTAIRQLAELLRAGRVPSEERRRQYHDVLLEQSERLSRLVNNVLDFARMEAGRDELSPQLVDLATLVEDTVSEARHRVAHEGFTIRTELERPLPPVHLDPDAVRQALGNLIDNGVKYSGESRELEVRGFRENGEVVLAVRDFGIGMEPDEAARVFERFYRGGDELTRAVKGTGLGLALVKHIAEAHGGRVDVTSAPGEGSTFSIHLPLDGLDGPVPAEVARSP